MLDRFLFSYSESVFAGWTDHEISDKAREGYQELYKKLRELDMKLNDCGDPEPVRIIFSPDARAVFVQAIRELGAETQELDFPDTLRGPWSKMEGYLARLCLILALCRAVDRQEPERVESRDVMCALAMLDYFKAQARKVYAGLFEPTADDLLKVDVAAFLREQANHWKGEASELYTLLESNHKPDSPAALSQRLGKIADRTPSLVLNRRSEGRDKDKRRVLEIYLKNGVPGVPGVPS